jgi:hypothetical protein
MLQKRQSIKNIKTLNMIIILKQCIIFQIQKSLVLKKLLETLKERKLKVLSKKKKKQNKSIKNAKKRGI